MKNLDDLLSLLSDDIAKTGIDANSPGEMVRASLAGQMPDYRRRLPMSLAGAPVTPVERSPMPPVTASPPPMAAPMRGGAMTPAAAPAPAQPSWGEDFMAGAAGEDLLTGIIGGLWNASNAPQKRAREAQQRNQTVQAIIQRDPTLTPEQAAEIARDPVMLREVFKPRDPVKPEYREVGGRLVEIGPGGVKEVYAPPPGSAPSDSETFGTTLNWTQDGRPYVVGNRGGMKFIDTGDAKPMPPDELARARAGGTLTGKTVAQAKLQLPQVLEKATNITGQLQSLELDPYLDSMVGPMAGRQPNLTGDAERVQAKMDQITGAAFLQAFESLKGGGQITEVEGKKATEAITMLQNVRMSPQDYRSAIRALKQIVRNGVIRAKVDAGELPAEELNKLFNVEALDLPTIGNPNPRAPGSRPMAGASGKSRIIGVE